MQTKESIYDYLHNTLVELFEVNPNDITPSALLYEDLDIDSIDAVDMVVKLKNVTQNKRLDPSHFKSVRTVQDVVDAVYLLLNESADSDEESPKTE